MGTTNPSNSVQVPGSNGAQPDESLQRALVTLGTQMATKATAATDPLTGKMVGIAGPDGSAVQAVGPSLVVDSTSAATANTAALQAALAFGGVIPVVVSGIIYINATLVYGDNTTLQLSPKSKIKMLPGLRIPVLKSASLGRMQSAPVSVSLTWASGMTFSVAWASHGASIGDPVWVDGATLQPQYKGVFLVESVTDAGNFVVRAKRLPTATPSGSVVAVWATKNTIIEGGVIDYSQDGNNPGALNAHCILNIGVYRVFTNGVTVNNSSKYAAYWGASLNCGFRDFRSDGTNSDGVKVYGPAFGFRGDGLRGIVGDDGCSFQTREPSAYVTYQPYYGDVLDCEIKNISVKSSASQAVFYTGTLATGFMDECRFLNISGTSPIGLRAVNNMVAVDAAALDYSAGYLWAEGLAGDYVTVCSLEQIQMQKWMLRSFRASTSRSVPQDQVIVNTLFYARDSIFDLGLIDSPSISSGAGFSVNFAGGADLLTMLCGTRAMAGTPRLIRLQAASTVRTLLIEKINTDTDSLVETIASNSPTIIIRNSRVGSLAAVSALANCTVALEGNDITNAVYGVIRGNATCTVTLMTNGANRLRAGSWAVQASGTLTLLVYGNDITLDPIASTFLGTTSGQYLTSTRAGAVNQGPAVRTGAGWVALGTGAAGINTVIS